jgi:hypothetical protein
MNNMSLGLFDYMTAPCSFLICWFGFFPGCKQVAWTARIPSTSKVRDGLELHGVSITCETSGGTSQGQRRVGCTAPVVKLVRIKVRHR